MEQYNCYNPVVGVIVMKRSVGFFLKIKGIVDGGGDINKILCGNSLIGNLMELYYLDKYDGGEKLLKAELKERKDGILEMLEWLYGNGADLNIGENPPLIFAVEEFDVPMTKYLISHGADAFGKINKYTGKSWCIEYAEDALINSDRESKDDIYEVVKMLKYKVC